jgi:molybdopterin synthase catalytic subunit
MQITVQLFAILREIAGASQLNLEVPPESTPRQVAQILAERFPKFRAHLNTLSFAVNDEIVSADAKIFDQSEVALLPPVSGG